MILVVMQAETLNGIVRESVIQQVPAGDVIFNRGDCSEQAFAVLEGDFFSNSSSSGEGHMSKASRMPTVTYKAGDVFGEVATLTNRPRGSTVTAGSEGGRLAVIERQTITDVTRFYAKVRQQEFHKLLDKVPFLVTLTPADSDKLISMMDVVDFEPGAYIIKQGRRSAHFYIIFSGSATVRRSSIDDRATETVLTQGMFMGENSLLAADDIDEKSAAEPAFVVAGNESGCVCVQFKCSEYRRRFGFNAQTKALIQSRQLGAHARIRFATEMRVHSAQLERSALGSRTTSDPRHAGMQMLKPHDYHRPVQPGGNSPEVAIDKKSNKLGHDPVGELDCVTEEDVDVFEEVGGDTADAEDADTVDDFHFSIAESDGFKKAACLGKGSFGEVWLSTCPPYVPSPSSAAKLAAVKIMGKSKIIATGQENFVKRERSILKIVNHPLVMSAYGTAQDQDSVYMGLHVCRGGDLLTVLTIRRMKSQLSRAPGGLEQSIRFYAAELLLALEYLHGLGIIYRDLKPENILLSTSGHIKLCDFGISYRLPKGGRSFTFCGTPEYIAPEVLQNKGAGKAVDLWSLGIVIYECLTGKTPFQCSADPDDEDSMQKYFDVVCKCEVDYTKPKNLVKYPGAVALIKALLAVDEFDRLGCGVLSARTTLCALGPARLLAHRPTRHVLVAGSSGIEEVKNHPWLSDVPWSTILEAVETPTNAWKPPYKPKEPKKPADTGNFRAISDDDDDYYSDYEDGDDDGARILDEESQAIFAQF
eukprot:SAG31_NODE_2143_length_6342_cov_5.402531_2_plen_759_part_00